MAARSTRVTALAAPVFAMLLLQAAATPPSAAGQGVTATRIVSLVPALTEILFAIGAGPQVVGVSSFDQYPPEVARLPRVGALIDPDTERILVLRPDLVITYGSQSELQAQLARAGSRVYSHRHGGIQTVLDTIGELGEATGRRTEAAALARSIMDRLDAIRARVAGRQRPRTLLVFGRQPGSLREVYASGGVGFLDEILVVAGGRNVYADVARESVQPSVEMLLTTAPQVIVELRASGLVDAQEKGEREAWFVLSSVPAVRDRRIHQLSGDYLVVPGPRLAQAAEAIARALHPDAF